MGQVYRATDTNLKRTVAIKVLPTTVASDAARVARFQREAEALARLNHPNIAQVHGLEKSDGMTALVMELVEGPTLADRIAQGPMPLDEALAAARQIAEALEAAHEQGIIHRDLKPANIALAANDQVKVLDFGLAKLAQPEGLTSSDPSASPTITSPAMMTGVGMILGTAAYMSPEQAKGRAVDKRSDVWAFGCVLYEMVTGRRAFPADDVSDTLALVLKADPDWNTIPSDVPRAVCELIQGCLRKNQKERISSLSTALFVLSRPPVVAGAISVSPSPVWRRATIVMASVLISATLVATLAWQLRPVPVVPVTRLAFTLSEGQQLNANRQAVALSPDGTRIVYAANGRLYLRSMSDFEATAIPGTAPAINPVFSPDGQSLVFWAESCAQTHRHLRRYGHNDLPGRSSAVWHLLGQQRHPVLIGRDRNHASLAGRGQARAPRRLEQHGRFCIRSATAARRRHAALHARQANRCGHRSMERRASRRAVARDGRAQATDGGWIGCAVRVDRPYRVCIGGNALRGAV